MSIFEPSSSVWASRMRSILRIIAGLMFILPGTMKLLNYPPMPPGQPAVELMSQIGIGGLIEVIGGVLFTIGLFTRPVSFSSPGRWPWRTSSSTPRADSCRR